MHSFTKTTFKILDLLVIFMMVFTSPMSVLAAPSPTGATIASDLADYSPGATVTLTGAGWAAGESVHIFVNDDINQQWSLDSNPDPVADGTGSFTYQFDLPDLFVATYSVTATGATSGAATTMFTDSIPNSVNMVTWKVGPGGWINGTLNANNSDYKEGETIPFRIELGTLATSGNPYSAAICRDYQTGTVFGYTTLLPFNTSRAATPGGTITSSSAAGAWPAGTFQGVGITITGVTETGGPGACGSTQRETIVSFNAGASGPQYLLWGGRLSSPTDPGVGFGNSASFYPGGSLQMRLESPDKTSGINPGGIIQLAKLTVTKVVDSGSATPDQWCFTVTGPNSYNLTSCVPAGQSSVDFLGLNSGSYTVTESNVAGYAFVSGAGTNCTFSGSTATATVAAAAGGATNASCTFHNAIQQGTLTVIKHVVTDNGGTATADQWSIHVMSGANEVSGSPQAGSESGTSYTLTGGTYAVSETGGPSGYTFTGFSGDCDTSGNVTVVAGQTKTCTLTNDDNTAHLKLVKTVTNDNGGAAVPADFTLSASGPTTISGAGGAESDVNAGTYTLSETNVAGYAAGSWSCAGGTFTAPDKIALALGQSATCTINNNDQSAHLTLVKTVTNDNGGIAKATDFTLSAAGPTPISGAGGADSDVNSGNYTLSETSVPGYTASSWSCTGGTFTAPDQIALTLGQSATCTINNDDNAPSLHLRKVVINNNGGTAVATDWNLSATGPTSLNGNTPVDSGANFQAGTYALSESGPTGYTASTWVCVGGTQNGSSITVGLGESATCTITNDDNTAHLKLIKTVTNDNGGTAVATDFTLSAAGPTPLSGAGGTESDVSAGTYTLSETTVPGYTAGNWSCTGGTFTAPDKIALALGESATCTISNDDQTAHLKLVKTVTNDNGGTAVATDFTLSAAGPSPISGAGGVESDVSAGTYTLSETTVPGYTAGNWSCTGGTFTSPDQIVLGSGQSATCTINNNDQSAHLKLVKTVTNDNGGTAVATDFTLSAAGPSPISGAGGVESDVNAGTYTLSETNVAGYTASSWSCSGGTFTAPDKIALALGQSATCTINNNDDAPALHLRKVVINDNGGTAGATDWTLSAAGPTSISDSTPVDSGVGFSAGTYALSESGPSGYTASAWSCVGGTQNGSNISLGLGQSATCTITNDDIAPKLHLRKVVVNDNGGTATIANFTLTADGSGSNDLSGTSPVDSGPGLQADTWALSESGPAGYAASAWSCVGGTQNGSSITVGIGGEATCTITNNDIQPKLTLVKTVVNDNGGTKQVSDFPLFVNTTSVTSGVANGFNAGSYTASETSQYGYTASAWGGDCSANGSVTLGVGDNKTCTITNDDRPGKIIIIKRAQPQTGTFTFNTTGSASGPGTNWPGQFTLNGDPTGDANKKTFTLDAGLYSVTESMQLGWVLTAIGGSSDPNNPTNCLVEGSGGSSGTTVLADRKASIDLKNGDTVTCIFDNTGVGATRTQGFWATHPQIAQAAWDGGPWPTSPVAFPGVAAVMGDTLICGKNVTSTMLTGKNQVMGAFWSDISKLSTGKKRSALGQARMQLLQQLIAAELNASAFGSLPSGGVATLQSWENALCGTNTTTIKSALQGAASFNSSGDSQLFTPGIAADSKYGRLLADIKFWDMFN